MSTPEYMMGKQLSPEEQAKMRIYLDEIDRRAAEARGEEEAFPSLPEDADMIPELEGARVVRLANDKEFDAEVKGYANDRDISHLKALIASPDSLVSKELRLGNPDVIRQAIKLMLAPGEAPLADIITKALQELK